MVLGRETSFYRTDLVSSDITSEKCDQTLAYHSSNVNGGMKNLAPFFWPGSTGHVGVGRVYEYICTNERDRERERRGLN